jgi:hypothetical protein
MEVDGKGSTEQGKMKEALNVEWWYLRHAIGKCSIRQLDYDSIRPTYAIGSRPRVF